jgi:hypothetical protein
MVICFPAHFEANIDPEIHDWTTAAAESDSLSITIDFGLPDESGINFTITGPILSPALPGGP